MRDSLTKGQEIALTLAPIVPGFLSLLGSATIVYLVLRRKRRHTHHRLLIMMSISDILHSLIYSFKGLIVPQTGGRVWALGNNKSCATLAFFTQLGSITWLYNVMLMTNYMLKIKFECSDDFILSRVEPFMHSFAILFPLATSIGGITGNVFGQELVLGIGCWVSDYPHGCAENGQYCYGWIIGWIYAGIPVTVTFIYLIIASFVISNKVRNASSPSSNITEQQQQRQQRHQVRLVTTDVGYRLGSSSSSILQRTNSESTTQTSSQGRRWHHITSTRQHERNSDSRRTLMTSRRTSGSSTLLERNSSFAGQRNRMVVTQSSLFVLAALNTVCWMGVIRLLESWGFDRSIEPRIFPVLLINDICYSAQGFCNFLIYMRPRYLRVRKRMECCSRFACLRIALKSEYDAQTKDLIKRRRSSLGTMGIPRLSVLVQEAVAGDLLEDDDKDSVLNDVDEALDMPPNDDTEVDMSHHRFYEEDKSMQSQNQCKSLQSQVMPRHQTDSLTSQYQVDNLTSQTNSVISNLSHSVERDHCADFCESTTGKVEKKKSEEHVNGANNNPGFGDMYTRFGNSTSENEVLSSDRDISNGFAKIGASLTKSLPTTSQAGNSD